MSTRSSSTPPAGPCAAASRIPCAERARSHPSGSQPLDPCQLRVGSGGEIRLDQLTRARFFHSRESTSLQQLVEVGWAEQAEESLTTLLGLGHSPRQAGGGHLAQLVRGNPVRDDQTGSRGQRGG